jgi:hypothetical protein
VVTLAALCLAKDDIQIERISFNFLNFILKSEILALIMLFLPK